MPQMSIWETSSYKAGLMIKPVEVSRKITLKLLAGDLDNALLFYKVFFDVEPAFVGKDYARFDIDNPPLNIILDKNAKSKVGAGHYGVQVKSTSVVREMAERLDNAGFKLITEEEADCCYALQTKIWAADPDGYRWEIFVVTEAETENGCGPECICHADFDRTMLTEK